ncbi:MAG TPA: hypothetical protein VLA76_01180 [Candidatus Angelobacter sp.]|nr:hypothetical protein [Candidatus Angelobacter sp.]
MTTWDEIAPDGIREDHERPIAGWRRHASPFSLVAFGVVVALGLSGLLGHERDWHARNGDVEMTIHASQVIRNGEFMELRLRLVSEEPITEPSIGVQASLWEDLTVNTMIPAATDESSEDGELRFTFGPIDGGVEFLWKVDLQVNPDIVAGNDGTVTVYDGEEELVSADLSIFVLP